MSLNVLETKKSVGLLDETAVNAYKDNLHSELIQTDDVNNGDTSQVHNSMIDKQPGLIARWIDVADVLAVKAMALLNMAPIHGPVRIGLDNHDSK